MFLSIHESKRTIRGGRGGIIINNPLTNRFANEKHRTIDIFNEVSSFQGEKSKSNYSQHVKIREQNFTILF